VTPGDTIRASGHLYVICTNPEPDGSVVGFNFTDADGEPDKTCPVHIGDHPYITKESVVAYREGDQFLPRRVENLLKLQPISHGPVSAALLLRIQEGAINSSATSPLFKKLVKKTLGRH
jgi:hypothetical protein